MYSARITRGNPSVFVILIDQSGSMEEKIYFGDTPVPKANVVASVTNDLITELINRSRREDGVNGYFDMAVYGYGDRGVCSMLGSYGNFVNISQVAALDVPVKEFTVPRVLGDGRRLMTFRRERQWIKPLAGGDTPMYKALDLTCRLLSRWCSRPEHKEAYPPVVFNITDGEATDADQTKLNEIAQKIKGIHTDDGNVLLFNIHIAGSVADSPVTFPADKAELPDHKYASLLYDMSSVLPPIYRRALHCAEGRECRAVSYNSGAAQVLTIIDVGSVTVNNLV